MSKLYLAYGSNLNLEMMKSRCPNANMVGHTLLKDYRLVYKGYDKYNAYLTIEPCEGKIVPLGIFNVSLSDRFKLDIYEGYPSLYHIEKKVITRNGLESKGFIYVMNNGYDYNIPSEDYILECYKGYKDFGFDIDILKEALEYTKLKCLIRK